LTSPPSSPPDHAGIVVSSLRKSFVRTGGAQVNAVDDVSLSVAPGEIVVLLGPSGCGKTTLLRCIAGLERPSSGSISIGGRTVYSSSPAVLIPTERRKISMMFQSYAVWPHMTVRKNVAYPLESQGVRRAEILQRVTSVLERVGIGDLADQHPGQLSGGQQQRVALARSLVVDPQVVLFDEPLSNVDAKVREQLRVELLTMQRKLKFAALYVTHDQEEAMHMADRLAVMRSGRVEQLGTPAGIYGSPNSHYVANFVGRMNQWSVVRADGFIVDTEIGQVVLDSDNVGQSVDIAGGAVMLVRPENLSIRLEDDAPARENEFVGTVISGMFLGSHTEYIVESSGVLLRVWTPERTPIPDGARVRMTFDRRNVTILPRDVTV